jgi:hypothetical protein
MLGFEKIKNYIKNLDTRETYRLIGITLGVVILIVTIMLYTYSRGVKRLQETLVKVNKQREEVRKILEKNARVQKQQFKVDDILAQNKNFKIKEYFNSVIQSLNLSNLVSKEPEISSEDLVTGYNAIKLDVSLSGLNMKQLTDLLYKIEQNERVYTKDLKITKNLRAPTIDVSLVIATFEATSTTA